MNLIFLDFETTGLDPVHDQPIELAAAKVNDLLEPIDGFASVIVPPHQIDSAKLSPIVIEMHTLNGLWAELQSGNGRKLAEVQDAFDAWLGDVPPGHYTLAGDSVHFDLGFLRNWFLPQSVAKFHFRLLDVSAFRVAREVCSLPAAPLVYAHRAQADVLASIGKAKWHLSRLAP